MVLDSPDGEFTREQDAKRRAGAGAAPVPGGQQPAVARGRFVDQGGPPFRGTFVGEHRPESNLPPRSAQQVASRQVTQHAAVAIEALRAAISHLPTTQAQRDTLQAAIDVLDKM